MFLEALPTIRIIQLTVFGFKREPGGPEYHAGFKHEGHCVFDMVGLKRRGASGFINLRIIAMWRHGIVQTASARNEAFLTAIILTLNEPHEFTHHIAMIPRRPVGILGDHPTRWKNNEIDIRYPGGIRG